MPRLHVRDDRDWPISDGRIDGESWQQQLLRLEAATDTVGLLPRTYFQGNERLPDLCL